MYLYGPTIDGSLVEDYTYRLFEEDRFIKAPVIFGDDTNKGTIFVPRNVSSVEEADMFLVDQYPDLLKSRLEQVNSWYLTKDKTKTFRDPGPYWRSTSDAYGEIRYTCARNLSIFSLFQSSRKELELPV